MYLRWGSSWRVDELMTTLLVRSSVDRAARASSSSGLVRS